MELDVCRAPGGGWAPGEAPKWVKNLLEFSYRGYHVKPLPKGQSWCIITWMGVARHFFWWMLSADPHLGGVKIYSSSAIEVTT